MSVISRWSFEAKEPAPLGGRAPLAPLPGTSKPATQPGDINHALAMTLLRDGIVAPHLLLQALRDGGRLIDVLLARRHVAPDRLYAALHRLSGVGLADLRALPPDPRLIDRLGAGFCLANLLLPWRDSGGITIIVTAHVDTFQRHYAALITAFGPVAHALAPPDRIEQALRTARGPQLARAAETLLPITESCRDFRKARTATWVTLGLITLIALITFQFTLTALLLWAVLTLGLTAVMKLAALLQTLRPAPTEPANPAIIARLPTVSVMVALYKEADIAARLVRRLGRLDYPRDLLDILLVVEEDDKLTRNALHAADLPPWMRVVVAPRGRVMTKPRALNFALTQCRGSIVGVYDAEDAPEADQIRKVVARFHQRGPQVACLQGVLDFYNPTRNWLSRCFTIEYASWFRVVLPGLQRLGLPLPLGGTTLFFRREVLEKLGGWDAHNVTEDADLGMRLVRHGYRTEVIDTTTYEEANCVALPWVKQRSRWVKGYMMTYLTHMRDPVLLWRQLGPKAFFGFQILFLGSLTQALLLPLMWSMMCLQFGLGHPVAPLLGHTAIMAIATLFVLSEGLNILLGITGLHRSGQKLSWLWVPTLAFYFPMQALAAYKAFWELLRCPFYWDKTSHGTLSAAHG
jgi:cellulose synthase/poly-beta-1,6-N-acetylglucosamine synthase-like glycosyltransferase